MKYNVFLYNIGGGGIGIVYNYYARFILRFIYYYYYLLEFIKHTRLLHNIFVFIIAQRGALIVNIGYRWHFLGI